jgi:alpha-tubulin suppressor-like RCC1 family protein
VGERFGCAALENNGVKCWGWNTHGQLGLGMSGDRGNAPGQMGDNLPFVNLGTGRTLWLP